MGADVLTTGLKHTFRLMGADVLTTGLKNDSNLFRGKRGKMKRKKRK